MSAAEIASVFSSVRTKSPLVHHLTNVVTVNDCANAVLAIGASPVMTACVLETADMAAASAGLVLNIGTPDETSEAAMTAAAQSANKHGVPVVLDPVGVGATAFRASLVRAILEKVHVDILRGNLAELAFLAGLGSKGRGVDSLEEASYAPEVAARVAKAFSCVAAITGAVDYVSDGINTIALKNGHPMLARVTGTGCMVTSLCGACAGAAPDKLLFAAAAGISAMSIAGEIAYEGLKAGQGTGSFHVGIIDALSLMTGDAMESRLHID